MLRVKTNANQCSDENAAAALCSAEQKGEFASAFPDVCVGRRGSGKPFLIKVHQVGGDRKSVV